MSVVPPCCHTMAPPSGVPRTWALAPPTVIVVNTCGSCLSCFVNSGVVVVCARTIAPKPSP